MAKKEFDAGDEEQVKERKNRAQLDHEREVEELRKLMSTRTARSLVWRILEQCQVFRTFGELDPHRMAMASGKRDVGLWLLEQVLIIVHRS